jgi:hypothetical protein
MKIKISKISRLSGERCSIYSVSIDDSTDTLFDLFLKENMNTHLSEIKNILGRIKTIGKKTGARESFFKINEGAFGDGICALYDIPESKLRLYCIRYGNQIVVLGGGGVKKKSIRALQEDDKLKDENYLLRNVTKVINKNLRAREEIFISEDGLIFEGELELDS